MRNLISINGCDIIRDTEKDTLQFSITISEKDYVMYYSVSKKYGQYLCDEVADGVISTFLPFAVRFNYDIESRIPVTQEFYYNIKWHFLPQITLCNHKDIPELTVKPVKTSFNPFAVSTGISCGVDSFTTLKEYTVDCELEDYRITHLAFFENGAHHLGKNGFSEEQKKCFDDQRNKVLGFCKEYGYEVVIVESNVNEVISKAFDNDPFELSHIYRNVGIVLQLQKLFKTYYYSSTYNLDHFGTSLIKDPAKYEKYLLSILSTDCTHVYSSNKAMERIEKTLYITDFPQTYDNLIVCYMSDKNCGKCKKCIRTLVTLDILGKLDLYRNSFDLEEYRKNRENYLSVIFELRDYDPFMKEIYDYIKAHDIDIPARSRFKGNMAACVHKVKLFIKGILLKLHVVKKPNRNW